MTLLLSAAGTFFSGVGLIGYFTFLVSIIGVLGPGSRGLVRLDSPGVDGNPYQEELPGNAGGFGIFWA